MGGLFFGVLMVCIWLVIVEIPLAITHDKRHFGRPCTLDDILDRVGEDQ